MSKISGSSLLLAVLVSGIVAFAVVHLTGSTNTSTVEAHSAYERVVQTRTIRCSYAAFPPFMNIDANKSLSGIFYDVVEEAAKRLNLKVEWTEEVTYGTINTGFETGRYDAFCAGLWPAGSRAINTEFSRAVVWEPMGVFVRGDDDRFDGHVEKINDPSVKITDIDGDATASLIDAMFPRATRVFMNQGQNIGEEIMNVTTKKADAMLSDYISTDRWLQGSPGGVKNISPDKPFFTIGVTIGFNHNELALRDMFDVVLNDMDRDGTIVHIVKQYMGEKSAMLYHKQDQFQPY